MEQRISFPITITVSERAFQVIGQALAELPFKVANPVIAEIQNQVNDIINKAKEANILKDRESKPDEK